MESIHLKGRGENPKRWCSKRVTLKEHFKRYHENLTSILKDPKSQVKDIYSSIISDKEDELTAEDLKYLNDLEAEFPWSLERANLPLKTNESCIPTENIPPSKCINEEASQMLELSVTVQVTNSQQPPTSAACLGHVETNDITADKPKENTVADTETRLNMLTTISSTMSCSDHELDMSIAPEKAEIFKVPEAPCRRSTRRHQRKPIEKTEAVNKDPQTDNTVTLNGNKYELPSTSRGNPELRQRIIHEIAERQRRQRRNRNNRKSASIRGQILVDTTRRLGRRDLVPRKNFVVTFRVHKPFQRRMGQRGVRAGKCLQEFDVLNCQTLFDLRGKIMCEGDYQATDGDVSKWPFPLDNEETLTKDKYKSGMFYIDNTFYVDMQEGTDDYSGVIKAWAEERNIKMGETKSMNEAKIEDLVVRFGYPYIYMHQGSCEHLIIVSDARLLTERSSLHSSDYPNLTKTSQTPIYYCVTCSKKPATWVVMGSETMLLDTNFMCDNCFYSYHYIGAEKIGRFKAYRWRQRAIIYH